MCAVFLQLAQGDASAVQAQVEQRRDAFEDDRSQTVVERLSAMADKLEAAAIDEESRDRKANTGRRARFARAALDAAAADKALAKTMRNIARAIGDGRAKFLDQVRAKTQVDMLNQLVRTAKDNELRAKYPSYADQEKRKGEPPTAETADFAEFPNYGAFRSDLAMLGRQLLEVDGTKKLGQRLMSVADDVTDAYLDFAKQNLLKVSQFGRGDALADFASREAAEKAIRQSGLSGKAIVLPVKRGQNRVVLSPSEAINRGIWQGDGDKRIMLTADFGAELVEAIGRRGTKQNKLTVPWQFQNAYDRRKALSRLGIETPSEFRSALREFIDLKEHATQNKVRELELQMVGRKADGLDFFPTASEIADQMIEAADLTPDMAVLEPSAGMGHLADRIRAAGAEPDVIEISADRRELLEEKGYHLAVVDDFLQMEPRKFFTFGDIFRAPDGVEGAMRGVGRMGSQRVRLEDADGNRLGLYDRSELVGVRHMGTWSGYDRIIMNPPFSNRRDAQHVRHAYDLLKPGGRIVAIMGEGVFFGNDQKAQDFREWLESVGGTSEKLPEGSFMDPSLPVNTAVNARMVVIDKPASAPVFGRATESVPKSVAEWLPDTVIADEVEKRIGGFAQQPPVRIRDTAFGQLPGVARNDNVAGAVHDGAIYLFRDQLGDRAAVQRTLFHELFHYGLRKFLTKDQFTGQMMDLYRRDKAIRDEADRWAATADGLRAKEFGGDKYALARGVDEALAILAEPNGGPHLNQTGLAMLVRRVTNWLADVAQFLKMDKAAAYLRSLHNSEARAYIQSVFKRLESDAVRGGADWSESGGPAFSRASTAAMPSDGSAAGAGFNVDGGLSTMARSAAVTRSAGITDRAIMDMVREGRTAQDILRFVASASKSRFNRQVARLLLKSGIAPAVRLEQTDLGSGDGFTFLAKYSRKHDALTLTPGAQAQAEHIVMHELIHAATLRALDRKGLASLQMRRLYEHVKRQGGAAGEYGMKNVGEFVAEVFTNPEFQRALRGISAPPGGTLKSAWDGFVRILRSILGLPQDAHDALSQALELGVAVMREDMRLRAAAQRAEPRAVQPLREARNFLQARIAAKEFQGKDLNNAATGMTAMVSRNNLDKMLSAKAVKKSETPATHAMAVANADTLFEQATLGWSKPDRSGDLNIKAIHRFFAPMDVDGRTKLVKLTVKETTLDRAHSLYTLEAVEFNETMPGKEWVEAAAREDGVGLEKENPLQRGVGPREDRQADSRETLAQPRGMNPGRSAEDIISLAQRVERDNSLADGRGGDAFFGAADLVRIKSSALDQLQQTLSHPGKVSLWDKTVGTMRHLAERAPAFKPVFEAAQRFIDDVSTLANDAADMAPRLLPRVESMSDLKKKPITAEDNKALARPLFEGTMLWARDVDGKAVLVRDLEQKYASLSAEAKGKMLVASGRLEPGVMRMWQGLPLEQFENLINSRFESQMLKAGVVWKAAELKSMFGLNDQQVSLYEEARKAIDRSIDMTARADMLRALGAGYAGLRDVVLELPTMFDAMDLITSTLQQEAKGNPDTADRLMALNNAVVSRYEKARDLQAMGYAPLSRFGRYTVDVVDQAGERQYFGMFDSIPDSNRMKEAMEREFPGATITQGTMSAEAYKLFQGITPESLELFGNMLGLNEEGSSAQDKVFQQYLQLTKNNHSSLKRLIHRKGIAGYSEDVGRVLASFVYSNARQAAGGLNAGTMENAINDIPKEHGELRDVALGLQSYIRDPQEEGQAVRGMLFAQYLGGSLASAFVNMTQPFAVTMPWLSQFGGMKKAGAQLARAVKEVGTKDFKGEPDLTRALQHAVEDGTVAPQEIHQLMGQARGTGSLRVGDGTKLGDARAAAANNWERVKVLWGQPFALAEQFNRRSTFIAAYRIAKEQGMPAPADFARRAVLETQFLYSKANKGRFMRGAVGGTLMTFKTYSVSYLELLQRTWNAGAPGSPERAAGRRAVGWAMAMLLLMGACRTAFSLDFCVYFARTCLTAVIC